MEACLREIYFCVYNFTNMVICIIQNRRPIAIDGPFSIIFYSIQYYNYCLLMRSIVVNKLLYFRGLNGRDHFLGYIDLLEKRTPYKNTNQIKLKDFGIFLY